MKENTTLDKPYGSNTEHNTIYLKVHRIYTSKSMGSKRTSDGWYCDCIEKINCEIWISQPIVFQIEQDEIFKRISEHYCSSDYVKDCSFSYNPNTNIFNQTWTKEICVLFNNSFPSYKFLEWTPDNPISCPFKLEPFFEERSNAYKYLITGQCTKKDTFSRDVPFSPFSTLEELKAAIHSLFLTGNIPPQQWIYYLIKESKSDISSFLTEHNIHLEYRNIKICNELGELWISIRNYSCEATDFYKTNKPKISYLEACRLQDRSAMYFYRQLGADDKYERMSFEEEDFEISPKQHAKEREEWINECQSELESWGEGWQWNID